MTPPTISMILVHEANFFQIRNRSSKCPKMDCLGVIENPLVLAKLSEPRKTLSFFQKVKIFAYCCHEKTLVIPENEKRNFEKHSFTTELSHRDTTFSTEIATVLNGWALSFQCFQKRLKFRFSKSLHAIYVYKKFSESEVFDTFWLPFVSFLTWPCHENTLVLPEQLKTIFENQVSTTEFRRRGTTSLTKIVTLLSAWSLTFQCL